MPRFPQPLAADPFVRLQGLTAAAVIPLYLFPILPPAWLESFSHSWLCPLLMVWPMVAAGAGWRDLPPAERPAWRALAIGLSCWMIALLLAALWPGAAWSPLENGLIALLYMGYYIGAFLSLTRLADAESHRAGSALEQRLSTLGVTLFVAGWVCYLEVVPGVLDQQFSSQSVVDSPMSVVLGLAVTAYAVWRWRLSATPRGRALAGGIALASATLLLSDTLNMFIAFGATAIADATWMDVFWALPGMVLVPALRLRALAYPEPAVPSTEEPVRTPIAVGIGLMFAGLSFPVVHSLLRLAGYLTDRNHAALVAMETLLIVASGLLITLAAVAHWLLERQSATLRRAHAALIERLDSAQKHEAIGRLAGGVAHDFNNLLTVIGGTSDLLLTDPTATADTRELLRLNREAVERAAGLTRQLLVFSRRQVSTPTDLDVSRVVQDMGDFMRRLVGEMIQIEQHTAPRLPSVRINKVQLEQVIMNLVVNARDVMPTGGRITIRTHAHTLTARDVTTPEVPPGAYVAISVTDTGPGIDDAVRPHIFEPFFTTKSSDGSRGVGLATAFGVIAQHAGAFQVDTAAGRGTTFTFYLPAEHVTPPTVASPLTAAPERVATARQTVLVVEDDDGVRLLTRNLLTTRGYDVLEAATPDAALALCQQRDTTIDVLLTDVIMPGMSGVALAERVEQARPGMRVLFMSGYPDEQLMQLGVDRHQLNFIAKPFSIDALVAKLRAISAA